MCQSFSSSLLQMFWTGHFFVVGLSCVFISTTGIYLLNSNGTLQVVIIRKCLQRFCNVHWGYKSPPSSWEPLPYLCMKFYKFFFFESQNNSFACLFIGTWKFSTNLPFLCVSLNLLITDLSYVINLWKMSEKKETIWIKYKDAFHCTIRFLTEKLPFRFLNKSLNKLEAGDIFLNSSMWFSFFKVCSSSSTL